MIDFIRQLIYQRSLSTSSAHGWYHICKHTHSISNTIDVVDASNFCSVIWKQHKKHTILIGAANSKSNIHIGWGYTANANNMLKMKLKWKLPVRTKQTDLARKPCANAIELCAFVSLDLCIQILLNFVKTDYFYLLELQAKCGWFVDFGWISLYTLCIDNIADDTP